MGTMIKKVITLLKQYRADYYENSLNLLTFLFIGLAFLQLGLVNNNLRPATFLPLAVLMICNISTTYLLHHFRRSGDRLLLPLIFFLSGLGLVLTARLAPAFINRQIIWLILATFLLLIVLLIPANLNWLRHHKYAWLLGGLCLLAATLIFGVNPSGFGARLWLQVGSIYFQPSEPLKLFLVVFLAAYIAERENQHTHEKTKARVTRLLAYLPTLPSSFTRLFSKSLYWGPMVLMWGFSIILLIWQRDLGAALLFFGTFVAMVYTVTGQTRYVWTGILLLAVAALIGYFLFDVVRLRFEAFGNPWLDPLGRSFQIVQSLLAFASGGLFGQGLGQGLPTAIPVVHTDFVFAAIGEEYGLVGALGILLCFMLLISRAFHIGLNAPNQFEQLLASGIAIIMGLQVLTIMAGTLKLMPLTGVTLPFVSYGGSSLLTSFAMVGLLMFISVSPEISENGHSQPSHFAPHQLRLARMFLNAFLVIAGGLMLWQVGLASFLVERSDNPRLIIAEQKIHRGALKAANGTPLAMTYLNQDGFATRHYPYPQLAAITGYYSWRYGVGGTEAMFDPILRGTINRTAEQTWLDELFHRPWVGRSVTLTIDLPAQFIADATLMPHEGAVVVLEIATGAVVVMSSQPTYDPNQLVSNEGAEENALRLLREDKRALLLNRATQGVFPVGDLAQLIGLIGLSESGATHAANLSAVSLNELLEPLGSTGYLGTVHQLGLTHSLKNFPTQRARLPDFSQKGTARDLAVTPIHLVRVMAALELEGRLPEPHLLTQIESKPSQAFHPNSATFARTMFSQINQQLIGFVGQATPQETGQPTSLSWFVGLAPTTSSQIITPTHEPLTLDPTKIKSAVPIDSISTTRKARYAIVVVVVTAQPETAPARRIAEAVMGTLMR